MNTHLLGSGLLVGQGRLQSSRQRHVILLNATGIHSQRHQGLDAWTLFVGFLLGKQCNFVKLSVIFILRLKCLVLKKNKTYVYSYESKEKMIPKLKIYPITTLFMSIKSTKAIRVRKLCVS